ncbi:MAG: chemotaxis response regulator protein-glutamate methylesterase [Verrucomicrobiota bacterium]
MSQKIKVLVVDDSAIVRKIITDALSKDPAIEVVGTAIDPYVARDKILQLNPDVLTLDIEMPRMDGLTFLKIIMEHRPMPVIIMSSLTQAGSKYALEALNSGAVDVLAKPSGSYSVGQLAEILPERVKEAAAAKIKFKTAKETVAREEAKKPVAGTSVTSSQFHPRQLILLGASTGGTEALKDVLTQMPDGLPGICIVQHIPAYFSKTFADRLNEICAFRVREAQDGDRVERGLALIAPGGFHMTVKWYGDHYKVHLNQDAMVCHQRPAVDVLFESGAKEAKKYVTSAILTGMGKDGAEGMLKLRQAGARTLGQSEETCVVYGMPRAAFECGAVEKVVDLPDMAKALVNAVTSLKE